MKFYPEGINDLYFRRFESVAQIKSAMQNEEVIEGRVLLCDSGHNLHIDLGCMQGIVPYREGAYGIQEGTVRDIALISKVNKRICFKIIGFHREGDKMLAVLSRRAVQLDCLEQYINNLSIGDVIDARITHLESFGAFIDIGAGLNSLIPIDMLSTSRINHPCERVAEGQLVRAVLKKAEQGKLTFSLKELLGTWEENSALFSVGETVTGVVRSVENYGIFVELMPNLAGLAEPCEGVEVGQSVSVYIKSILSEKMKIKLVIVESFSEEAPLGELVYFDERRHIDCWRYSPPQANRIIETRFDQIEQY